MLALANGAYAADYTVYATVNDIDGKPLSGMEVAVGSIKTDLLKTSVEAETSGTTDAAGQVTVTLSTSAASVGATVIDPDPGRAAALKAWGREYWNAVHPYNLPGAYVNFMMDEPEGRVQATYGENYPRLVQVKERYDPTNLFRVNHNIAPARAAEVPLPTA